MLLFYDEIRDIYIVRQVKGEWTKPKAMHADGWKIKGCPVNGPKAAAIGNTLAVAWFTEAHKKPRVQLTFSTDGGANFQVPIQIATGKVLGRVDVFLIDSDAAVVSWMEIEDEKELQTAILKSVKVSQKGKLSAIHNVATLDASRKTGFPQMERVGNQILFAWTDVSKSRSEVKTASVPLQKF